MPILHLRTKPDNAKDPLETNQDNKHTLILAAPVSSIQSRIWQRMNCAMENLNVPLIMDVDLIIHI